ncbi:MAG: DUF4347 domain-containing protein, partial [Gammaproteobacteria bacterium]|nr:DUF4347 domain-containing protein [Gammaproteobacteria bacterium]
MRKRNKSGQKRGRVSPYVENLEPRILFSADFPGVDDTAPTTDDLATIDTDQVLADAADEFARQSADNDSGLLDDVTDVVAIDAGSESIAQVRHELVVVAPDVPDYDRLLADIQSSVPADTQLDIVVLGPARSGMTQIGELLAGYDNLDAFHLVSHASDGSISLGEERIDLGTLEAQPSAFATWGEALSADGDILIYGCDLAASESGQLLVDTLAEITGADVAASDDITGNAEQGGDWELEYTRGTIDTTSLVFDQVSNDWQGTLATYTVTTTSDGGAGSLREAIINANANAGADTIVLGAGTYTLTLTGQWEDSSATGDLDITSDITIQGTGAGTTIISASGLGDRAFDVKSGATLNLSDLTVADVYESNQQGGAIANAGTVTATDVVFRDNVVDNHTGGALYNSGTMTLTRVSVYNNTAAAGGGIEQSGGLLTLTNVTVSSNSSAFDGAGIRVSGGTANISFTTVAANVTTSNGNAGGLYLQSGTANINNSIFADNTSQWSSGDITGAVTSGGHNIIEDYTGFTLAGTDQSADPGLSTATYDSDSGQYLHTFSDTSIAYDAADASAPATDQRNLSRDANPDIGAFELGALAHTAPSGTDGTIYAAQDTDYVFTLADFGFTDLDGDSLENVWFTTLPSQGTLKWNGSPFAAGNYVYFDDIDLGLLTWTPPAGVSGDSLTSFTFQVEDNGPSSSLDPTPNTLTINVAPSNTAPSITSDGGGASATVDVAENTTAVTTVTATDLDGDTLTYSLSGGADIARFTIDSGSGALSFIAAPDFESPGDVGGNNVYNVTVQVSDGNGGTDTQDIAVTVTNIGTAAAVDDSFTGSEDTVVVGDVLANDPAADGGVLTAALVDDVSNGSLTLNSDGSFSYVPDANWNGSDSFEYLSIDPSTGLSHYWGLEGDGVDAVGTADGTLKNGPATVAGHDGDTLAFDGVNDYVQLTDVSYTNEFSISFYFKVDDNSGSGIQYFYSHGSIGTNNVVHVGLAEASYGTAAYQNNLITTVYDNNDANTAANQIYTDISGLINDGQWHFFTLTVDTGVGTKVYIDGSYEGSSTSGGDSLNASGNAVLGARSDLDPTRFLNAGSMIDSVAIYDRTLSSSEVASLNSTSMQATATITVSAVNDAPVVTSPTGTYPYSEGMGAVVLGSSATVGDVDSANFDGGTLHYQITANGLAEDSLDIRDQGTGAGQIGVSGNTITYGGVVIGTYTGPTTGDTALVVTFNANATAAAVEATLKNVTYENTSQDPNETTRTLEVYVTDGDGGTSATVSGQVSVSGVNDAPVITSSATVNAAENQTAVTTVTVSDVDGGTPTFAVTGGADQGWFSIDTNSGVLTFSSAPDFESRLDANADGVYEVEVTVYDGNGGSDTQLILVTVDDVGETPTIGGANTGSVTEDVDPDL